MGKRKEAVTSDEEEAATKQRPKRNITVKKPKIPSDDEDEEQEEEERPLKKKKADKPSSSKKAAKADDTEVGSLQTDETGNKYLELGKKRRATVSSFKGAVFLNIREYYDAGSGDLRPGKKGISLSAEQWNVLKDNAEIIDTLFAKAKK
ncbi:transcriptional Coactivator p15-domain-containing protein [Irpex lacteus]|nr:transcriptional Coactivator p15-domain-containing protein [Irpex lacteus]